MPENVADELQTMIQEGRLDEASDYCADPANESLIAEVVAAGLQRFRSSEFGFAEYKAAVEEAGEDQTGRLYRKTEVLGVVGTIAPMLGLLGTVLGMIEAFNQIAATEGARTSSRIGQRNQQGSRDDDDGTLRGDPGHVGLQLFSEQDRFDRGRNRETCRTDPDSAGPASVDNSVVRARVPMRLSKRRRPTKVAMNMTPMIDVTFLLLIFFMTVSQVSKLNREQLELPRQQGTEEQKPSIMTVNINQAGQLIVGGTGYHLSELISLLGDEISRLGDDPSRLTVVLRAIGAYPVSS